MIKNKTKNNIICKKSVFIRSVLRKALGLMFSRKIFDEGWIFVFEGPRKVDLHMFFVFFPIDVIFLDSKKKVLETKEKFMPFSLYSPATKSDYVLELPNGAIKKSKIEVGDIISF